MKNQYLFCFGIAGVLLSFQTARSQYGSAVLDTNDAAVRFQSNGLISLDPSTSNPNFFLPHTSGGNSPSPLFAAGLWIGGVESNGTLRLAAERFEQNGHDFFPGPLGTNASIDPATSALFDVPVVINRSDYERHVSYFNCLADPNCDEAAQFPGYAVPASFYQWPGNGDISLGQDLYLAPYVDYNMDGT